MVAKSLFSQEPREAAEKLRKVQSGDVTYEVEDVVKQLKKKGYKFFTFENEALAARAKSQLRLKVEIESPCDVIDRFRDGLETRAGALGIPKMDYSQFLRDVSVEVAKVGVAAAVARRDLFAAQTVRAIDDLDKTLNLYAGRIREWYGSHFPELDRLVEKHESYVRLIAAIGSKESFTEENLVKEGIPKDKAKQIAEAAQRSMGAPVRVDDLEWIRNFCSLTSELYKFRDQAGEYVGKVVEEVAPNMSALIGPVLTARLISLASGLENLAKMPSSTVQVLGAEKALFRSLKTGARPPKHGIIFQYTQIHQSPRWQRGKIARALSGKLAIAARVDAFKGAYTGDRLKASLEKKIKDIQERYAKAPVREKRDRRKG